MQTGEDDASRMRRAAVEGDIETVRVFLDVGVSSDSVCNKGYTALHHAAWYGRTDVLQLLLERGASPDVENNFGSTPLFHAVSRKHLEAVRLLLAAGAEPNRVKDGNNTPLHASCTRPDIAQLLLEAGANIAMMNRYNMGPFAYALVEGDVETARFWGQRGAPLYLPTDTKFRGILKLRLMEDPDKAAIVREYAPDVAGELLSHVQQRGGGTDE